VLFSTPHTHTLHTTQPLAATDLMVEAELALKQAVWPRLEITEQVCFNRVLDAFTQHQVAEHHFYSVTGYGHDDMGRTVIDQVFAHALQAEAALVRTTFASGTHAIAVGLKGCLTPGKRILVVTGPPYDTLEEVMGLRGNSQHSLAAQGVSCSIINLLQADGRLSTDWSDADQAAICAADVIHIQRSRGYSSRETLSIHVMRELIQRIKALKPNVVVFVDNCYGEFTETDEPTAVGADLMAGSLIKNPGGGIVPAGGYVAGRTDLVAQCAEVLTCPGVGAEGGYTFNLHRLVLQGLFMAPTTVCQALKSMTLAAYILEKLGYAVSPAWDAPVRDIIQQIGFHTAEALVRFCQIIQQHSPINSHVKPIPAQLPGYADAVVMAGGTFIEGSTIELSADGPLREPYIGFLQGGLTVAHIKAILPAVITECRNPLRNDPSLV
jgi:cystathionine beta-lyase family protein involved in aluminum resistance